MTLANPIDLPSVERLMLEAYGISATAQRLVGECDLNFAIQAEGRRYLLKVARAEAPREEVEFQNRVMEYLASRSAEQVLLVQRVLPALSGQVIVEVTSASGVRLVRVLSFLEGRMLADVSPHHRELLESLGTTVACVDSDLEGLSHPYAGRPFKWNLAQSDAMLPTLACIQNEKHRAMAARHLGHFATVLKPRLAALPECIIHGDANDYNVVVSGTGYEARVSGLIDFGDAMLAPMVCGLAITLAYAMLGKSDPLAAAAHVVRGYHRVRPLDDLELEMLYPLALTRLAVSVTNSASEKMAHPENAYLTISEAPAWALLEQLDAVDPQLAHFVFRNACGLEPVPNGGRVRNWLKAHQDAIGPVVSYGLGHEPLKVLDQSVSSPTATMSEITVAIGRYGEPRCRSDCDDAAALGEHGVEHRTLHLGMELFVPAESPVMAPLAGVVHSVEAGCVMLQHTADDGRPMTFWTRYGGLRSVVHVGQHIQRGQILGNVAGEGHGSAPHVHLQVMSDLLDVHDAFPRFVRPSDAVVWMSLCPDPNLIAQIPAQRFPAPRMDKATILFKRHQCIGRNLSISFREPLNITRGQGQYLYDENGQRYLDCYNNVPHVGHSHPHVVRAAQQQMAVLTTNTRYLHENLVRYAERLTAKLPQPLSVCYFVSSGSEATELALRLAQAHTKKGDLIVCDHAYHGHTTTLIDISPYKAEGPGGVGLPDWVHKVPVPDDYRGRYKRGDEKVGESYAADLDAILADIEQTGRGLRGFIIESIPSVGGQIVLPQGYLQAVYRKVRAAGGLCIADEVQTGFGRVGSHFWGFEHQGVVPDIVAMGKPIGNGFPLGAVVTTPEIAASFDNGMEYFATFGGSPVACAVGMAVLDVIEAEGLQKHAHQLGNEWMNGLRLLQQKHAVIGDVRGLGLFNGIELVRDRETREPAPQQAAYVVNRLRDFRILTGTDGPHHNVIKLRGPMVISKPDVDAFLTTLDLILSEDAATV